jgi:phospholipase C
MDTALFSASVRGDMFLNVSIRRASRLKMIAGVSMTALMGLGATGLFPQDGGRGALAATAMPFSPVNPEQIPTETPIKHIIYIVGENRSFDNVYGTYQPKHGQKNRRRGSSMPMEVSARILRRDSSIRSHRAAADSF